MAVRITDLTPLGRGGGPGVPPGTTQQRPLTARGKVAVAPASETDKMQVVVETTSLIYAVEIPAGNWTPRGTALPAVGDPCLVVYDDIGDAFVPVWSGTTTIDAIVAPPRARSNAISGSCGASSTITVTTGSWSLQNGMAISGNGIKVPVGGYYSLTGIVTAQPTTAVGYVESYFSVNGSGAMPQSTTTCPVPAASTDYPTATAIDEFHMNAGDVATLIFLNGTGATLAINGGVFIVRYTGQ